MKIQYSFEDKENMDPIHVKQGSTGSVDTKFLYRKPQDPFTKICKVVSTANNIHKADILPLPRTSIPLLVIK
jgi:hypothetical protein